MDKRLTTVGGSVILDKVGNTGQYHPCLVARTEEQKLSTELLLQALEHAVWNSPSLI